MTVVTVYKGITIMEEYGFYYPAIDNTVESMHFEDILKWIDAFFMQSRAVDISYSIMSEYFQSLPFKLN